MTHICVGNRTVGSDKGLSPGRHQAIIWSYAGILFIGPLGTNFNEILIKIQVSLAKMSSAKCLPFLLGLSVLTERDHVCRLPYATWMGPFSSKHIGPVSGMQRRQYGYKVFSNSETHYDSSVNAVTIGLNTAFIFRGRYTIKWTNNDILAIAKWWPCLDDYEYTSLVHTELFLNLSSDTLAQSWSNGEYVNCLAVSRNSDGINLQQV